MRKQTGLLVLIALSALAGCSFSFGDDPGSSQVTATEVREVNNERETPAATTTDTDRTEATTDGQRYGPDTDTGEILLSLPELGQSYNFSSESMRTRSELSSSEKASFEEQGLLKRHERVFSLADGGYDGPPAVISTVAVYDSERAAASATPELVESIREAGGTAEQVEIASGVEATRLSGETQTGRKNVLITWQTDNLIIWVVTSGIEQSYPEVTEEYFVEMVLDVP